MNRRLILGVIVFFLFACGKEKGFLYQTANKLPVKIEIHRFDQELYEVLDADSINLTCLKEKYPRFFSLYCEHILSLSLDRNRSTDRALKNWFKQKEVRAIYQSVNQQYHSIANLQNEIDLAFTNLYSYLANKELPEVFLSVSGFNQSVVSNGQFIAVSLDKYLGKDYPLYKNYFYQHELKTMSVESIPKDVVTAWFLSTYNSVDIQKLLDGMIYYGKLYFVLSKVFPEEREADLFNFSEAEFSKVKKTKAKLWNYLAKSNLLNSNDQLFVSKLLGNESFSLFGLGTLPSKTGAWLGYHIVKSYVEKNGPLSLNHLLYNHNSQMILTQSAYNPKHIF